MDGRKHSFLRMTYTPGAAPIIVDVRRDADFAAATTLLADAFHRSPDDVEQWRTDLPNGRQVVTYRVHGREVSYDALYTWCHSLRAEAHNWPATKSA